MMDTKRIQKPVWIFTEELFEWMQTICNHYQNRETLADVYLRDSFWYAADGFRLYRIPEVMISRRAWYIRHREIFTVTHNFDYNVNKLPCARNDISSRRYPDISRIINEAFESMGEITTRDLWIQCHDMFARGHHGSVYTMPILDSEWQVQTAFVRDMLSLPHILGGMISVSKGTITGAFRFDFEYDVSAYISPYGM